MRRFSTHFADEDLTRVAQVVAAAIMLLAVLIGCGFSSRQVQPGVFRLDPAKSKFVAEAAASGLDLEVTLEKSGRFDIQPMAVTGTWKAEKDTLRLSPSSTPTLLNAMEGRDFNDQSPLELSFLVDGNDRIVWKPSGFNPKRPLELVFTRSSAK